MTEFATDTDIGGGNGHADFWPEAVVNTSVLVELPDMTLGI